MLTIDDSILQHSSLSETELRKTIAVLLFERKVLSFYAARKLSGMQRLDFEQLLAKEKVMLNDSVDDLREDLLTLEKLRHDSSK